MLKCASPGTEIGFDVIKATFFRHSNSQVNSLSAGPLVAEVAIKAEANGYDAVVPFGTLDAGIELSRNLVKIPVVGAGQSVMHLGAQLSNRLGVVAYEDKSIPFMRKQIHAWVSPITSSASAASAFRCPRAARTGDLPRSIEQWHPN